MALDREGPWLEMDVHVWSGDGETDAAGYYLRKNQTLARLHFNGIVLGSLSGFGPQNVLFELLIQWIEEAPITRSEADQYFPDAFEGLRYRVTLDSSYGFHGWFGCASIQVVETRPWPVTD